MTLVLAPAAFLARATAAEKAATATTAVATKVQGAQAKKPERGELAALLKRLRPKDGFHVSRVLDDLGDGRFAVLLRKKGRICDKGEEQIPKSTSTFQFKPKLPAASDVVINTETTYEANEDFSLRPGHR